MSEDVGVLPDMERFRQSIRILCPVIGKDEVTVEQLMSSFGLRGRDVRKRVAGRLRVMTMQGELTKSGFGRWCRTGTEKAARGEGYAKMWRAIRTTQGEFAIREIVRLAHLTRQAVGRYCAFLEEAGLVRAAGKNSQGKLFVLSVKGRAQRRTPFPAKPAEDLPYLAERRAAAELVRVMLCCDPGSAVGRAKVRRQLAILNTTFCNQDENAGGEA